MTAGDGNPLSGTDWEPFLKQEFEKDYWRRLESFLEKEGSSNVCPPPDKIFAAFHLTSYAKTNVVILGQDPYPGEGQADGLCFSGASNVSLPPTLRNILRELRDDCGVTSGGGSLEPWARQGVLLLNTILTVKRGKARSHRQQGWETFTDEVIRVLNKKDDPVFVLWGKEAQRKRRLIDESRHAVVVSPHPSPLSAWRGFFNSKPFSKVNAALRTAHKEPVDWSLG